MTAPLDPPAVRWLDSVLAPIEDPTLTIDYTDDDRRKAAQMRRTFDQAFAGSRGIMFAVSANDARRLRFNANRTAHDLGVPIEDRRLARRLYIALGGDHA